MSQGPFIAPVGRPQDLFGSALGNVGARAGILETGRTPKRFELVSDIDMPVVAGAATWMFGTRDMEQYRLVDFAAAVYDPSPADDIELMIFSSVWGDLLSAPLVILAGEQHSYPTYPAIIPGFPIFSGDIITFDVLDPGAGAAGLAFAPSFG